MKRKIIQVGHSTQLVSLPRKWCIAHNIKKGDEIEVEGREGRIILSTDKVTDFETAELNISELETSTIRFIHTYYKKGTDEITIRFKTQAQLRIIHELVDEMIGFGIIKQDKNSCIIRAVAQVKGEDFDPMFKRTFMALISMAQGFHEMLKTSSSVIPSFSRDRYFLKMKYRFIALRALNDRIIL